VNVKKPKETPSKMSLIEALDDIVTLLAIGAVSYGVYLTEPWLAYVVGGGLLLAVNLLSKVLGFIAIMRYNVSKSE
jgi:hypothetical protein